MTTPAPLIDATGLCRRYGRHLAVEDVSLQLARGEVLGLLGPNGAGKTTTLRMLAGILAPTRGHIRIAGIDLAEDPRRARQHLGYLPETPPLHRELTVTEYLRFCAQLREVADADGAVRHALQACGLNAVARQLIGSLSKGYQQRVGLAQAIIHKPDVIILDEPTVGLDPNQIREIRALIRELASEHAVILSTHILGEVQATCSRVSILTAGRTVFDDTINELQMLDAQHILVVGLHRPPPPDELLAVSDILDAEPLAGNRFRLHCAADSDPRERLASVAATRDWGLFELREERRTLEDLFADLTRTGQAT